MIRLASGIDIPVFDTNTKPDPAYFVGIALIRGAVNGDTLLFSDGAEWVNVGGSGGGVATLAPVFKGGFAPPDGEVGAAYSYDVSALFSGTVESYVVYNGALSNGLTLNAVSGILSGTPTGTLSIPSFSVAALNAHGGAISNGHNFAVTESIIYPVDDVGGVAPLYAYGVAKLVSSYSGPALRIIRASDSAEMDIGFVGNKLDMASVISFLGAGVKGKVLRLYDQSGNGNHTDIQADDAKRLEINMPLKINGESSVNGFPPLWGANFTYELPATLTCSRRNLSAYSVITGGIGNDAIVEFGTSPNNASQFYSPGALIGYIYNTNKIYAVENPSVVELHLSSTNRIDAQGDHENIGSSLTEMTLTGGRIGNITIAGGYLGSYHGLAWMAYGRALSTVERSTLKGSLNSLFSMTTVPGRVVFVGDSITAGYSNTAGYDSAGRFGYAYQSIPLLSKKVPVHNAGLHGGQLVNYVADYATKSGPFLAEYADNRVVFLMMGTNDLTVGGRTAAQIYADYQTYAANVRASGAKIIVATILPNDTWDATKQTTRNDLNTLIRDNWATFADGFCDFASDPTMGPQSAASDNTLYPDGLHPSELGHSYLAPLAATAINALL